MGPHLDNGETIENNEPKKGLEGLLGANGISRRGDVWESMLVVESQDAHALRLCTNARTIARGGRWKMKVMELCTTPRVISPSSA